MPVRLNWSLINVRFLKFIVFCVKLTEIKFSIFLNFFDVISIFFDLFSMLFILMCYLSILKNKKKTPAVKFLDLIFAKTFLSSILAKCVRDESCRGEFPPTSPKGLVRVAQTDFCVYRWRFCNKLNSS